MNIVLNVTKAIENREEVVPLPLLEETPDELGKACSGADVMPL